MPSDVFAVNGKIFRRHLCYFIDQTLFVLRRQLLFDLIGQQHDVRNDIRLGLLLFLKGKRFGGRLSERLLPRLDVLF